MSVQLARTSPETVTLDQGRYRQQHAYDYGDAVPLPGPVDVTLDTEELKNYAR